MIKQTIKFNSSNKYFGGFLQALIKQSEINGSVTQENGKITLLLDNSNEAKVTEFNTLVANYLPHSIFLDEITTEQTDEVINNEEFSSPTYNIAPCNKCIELLTVPSLIFIVPAELAAPVVSVVVALLIVIFILPLESVAGPLSNPFSL